MDNFSITAFGSCLATVDAQPVQGQLGVGEWATPAIASVMTSPVRQSAATEKLAAFAATRGAHVLHGGPGQWLVIDPQASTDWLDALAAELGDMAELFDQSSGFGVLRMEGGDARRVLQKGLFIDLEAALDEDGKSVASIIAHVSVTVWRLAPDHFGIAVPRSYAGSFWHWFEAATAAEGIRPYRIA